MNTVCHAVFLIWLSLAGIQFSNAQVFETRITTGVNFAHIKGDGLSGMKKTGLSAGLGITSPLSQKIDWNVDLLYNRRGSSQKFKPGKHSNYPGISLHYADIPVYLSFKDWEYLNNRGETTHRMKFNAGITLGRLLKSAIHDSFNGNPDDLIELERRFQKTDIGWLIGAGVHILDKVSFNLRYTRSIRPIFDSKKNSDIRAGSLLGSFISVNIGYHL